MHKYDYDVHKGIYAALRNLGSSLIGKHIYPTYSKKYDFVVYDDCPEWLFALLRSSLTHTSASTYDSDSDSDMEIHEKSLL